MRTRFLVVLLALVAWSLLFTGLWAHEKYGVKQHDEYTAEADMDREPPRIENASLKTNNEAQSSEIERLQIKADFYEAQCNEKERTIDLILESCANGLADANAKLDQLLNFHGLSVEQLGP